MRDAARSGSNKRWALSNWDLRWKVTAVLAVPLLVAVVLGASRISTEFADSSRLATAVDHVGVIPAITGLSANAAQVAGGQMIYISPTQSLTSDPELQQLDTAIDFAQKATSRLSDIPSARSALDEMITGAKAIRAQGLAPAKAVTDSTNAIEKIRGDSVRTVETIVASVADKTVDQSKLRLVDSLNTRAIMVAESAGVAEALRGNTKDGLRDFTISGNTERQMLGILAHRFADGDPQIADLNRLLDTRLQLTTGAQASSGQLPVADLKDSVESSLNIYQTIVNNSTKEIVSRVDSLASTSRTDAIRYSVIVIATILGALALAVLIARAMIVPLRRLRLAALRVAEYDLGQEATQLRDGADPEDVPLEPMPVHTDEEIGQLARAIDDIHGQALRLAADQATMRVQVNDMFETLARRSKSLVDHQLSLIEAMEYDEKDPRLLENLFRLDHLAARMRRNGDNLLILAGTTKQRRGKSVPVEIADVLRAAISEVEDYERVKLGATPRGSLTEPAASDMAHLFAELLDNALRASPPETDVKFTFAQAHDQGLLIEVADRGIGMPPAEMAEINRRLETTAEVGPDTARHMGLFVVGRLAERHGLVVRLRPTFDTARDPGVTVTVHVPKPLIVGTSGPIAVPPQPNQQQPAPAAPQGAGNQAGAPSSMQMRAVTRTATGNVMVTVDPGVSGPIPAGAPAAPAPAAASASTGLPTRQPGVAIPGGLPGGGGLPQRQPGVNGPTVKHTVAAPAVNRPGGLPRRDPGANGPAAPSSQPGANLPQRQPGDGPARPGGGLAANMLRRQGGPGGPGAPGGLGAPGGQPQRPGGLGAPGGPGESGLQQRGPVPPQRDPSGGLAPRDLSGGLPQRDASGGLPQRDASGGLPPRDPSNGLPQRGDASGGLPTRQPGANGAPGREPSVGLPPQRSTQGGLPTRDPGKNGAPQRDGSNGQALGGGAPQRETGLPQRDSAPINRPPRDPAAGGLPPRDLSGGLPQRDASGGLPQRDASGGLPQRDASGGLPQRDASGGLPQRDASGGLPPRDLSGGQALGGGAAQRDASGGLPQRDPASGGLPQRDASGGLPQRDASGGQALGGGAAQREPAAGGLPQRADALGGLPPRDPSNGLPQRGDASGGLPQRDASGGLPQRDATGGLPQRDATGATGLSQRDTGRHGLPPRDAGLPQRDPAVGGLPQRDVGQTNLPGRDAGGNRLPQRDPAANGLPQRDAGATGIPQRDQTAGGGLPRRAPGGNGAPQQDAPFGGLPQRAPTGGLPQRDPASGGLPQRDPASGGLPQRDSGLPQRGATGLPQRDPGAGLPQRPASLPGIGLPQNDSVDPKDRGRHSFRSNPQKAASFFQTRLQPAGEAEASMGTPIFAEMMSAWLTDPSADRSQVANSFESPGDEGWQAAQRAVEAEPQRRTPSGLPQRDPGNRLVPGGVNGNADKQAHRDPESIRSSLSRHQQGVRDGRAMKEMNLTGDKGDR
ncbi:MAG: Signal transduction histidine-protein kinase/phosphatase MprB [Nocardia sp.]|uniref:sensor histidine kinase n=1 Tax=Nocardia sp. TaxID=1821 RepID=UPI00262EA1D0|nr:ATP-binding protein [Nocardia sp.]MCU1646328.1 Signal transduction histidine-protein kinase/phosphatase MprB [Nocardia sp.]